MALIILAIILLIIIIRIRRQSQKDIQILEKEVFRFKNARKSGKKRKERRVPPQSCRRKKPPRDEYYGDWLDDNKEFPYEETFNNQMKSSLKRKKINKRK